MAPLGEPPLLIYAGDEGDAEDYTSYKPPELSQPEEYLSTLDVRKCDLWTLGLVCWEILAGGIPYYEDPNVAAAMSLLQPEDLGLIPSGSSLTSDGRRGESLQKSVNAISGQLKDLAKAYVDTYTKPGDRLRISCAQLFDNLFQVDASARNPRALPFATQTRNANTAPREQLVQRTATEKQWSFATFKPSRMALSPSPARLKIFEDFERMALHKETLQAARAQLHIAFAYGVGFGTKKDIKQFQHYLQKAASNGLNVAKAMLKLVQGWRLDPSVEIAQFSYRIRAALQELTVIPRLEGIGPMSSYETLDAGARKAAQALSISPIPATIYAVYHKLVDAIPKGVRINERDPATGETALAVACRLGDYESATTLLSLGADASIPANDGCLPLHWLFMFNKDQASVLARGLTRDWWIQYINCVTIQPRVFDSQFPFSLHGSPLAFAVMTRAHNAVDILLELGADPRINIQVSGHEDFNEADWDDRSPLSLAARFHLEGIFNRLWAKAVELHDFHQADSVIALSRTLACSSHLERQIIHGKAVSKAGHFMARRLRKLGVRSGRWDFQMLEPTHYVPLQTAVDVMDLDISKALLQELYGTSINARDILFHACVQKACTGLLTLDESIDLIEFALTQGCNVNTVLIVKNEEWRAVDYLIWHQQGTLLLWLLKYRPDVTRLGNSGTASPLYQIIENGLSRTVNIDILLLTGADPNFQEDTKAMQTSLHLAVAIDLIDDVRKLLAHGADPNIKDVAGVSPFLRAIRVGNTDMVRELLNYVLEVNRVYDAGATALSFAASLNNPKIVELLLEKGAKIESSYPSAFHVAASLGKDESLKVLLGASKDFNLRDAHLNTPLQLAIQSRKKYPQGAFNCVLMLLEAGANPNTQNATPTWALHAVFRYFQGPERFKIVELFHKNGAQLDVRDASETTILHLAAFMGDRPMVKYLLKAGLSPALLGNQKQTPVHDCVRSLDQKGGAESKNIAALCGIIVLLVRAGADIPYQPNLAMRTKDPEEAKLQVDENPDSNETHRWSIGRSLTKKVQRDFHKMSDRMQAKKKLEQEERAVKVEGMGLLVFRDYNNLTPLELAMTKKKGPPIVDQLLKLHNEALKRLDTNPPTSPGGDSGYDTSLDKSCHNSIIGSAALEAVTAKNWAALRYLMSNEFPIPQSAHRWSVGINLLDHAFNHNDLYLLSIFLPKDSKHLVEKVLRDPKYPWPELYLPDRFCANLHLLLHSHGENVEGNPVAQGLSLLGTEAELDKRAGRYDYTRYSDASFSEALRQIWQRVCNLDLETASYLFNQKHIDELIYLSGTDLEQEPLPTSTPVSLAPGKLSTPLLLIYQVWTDPVCDSGRIKQLTEITSSYLSALDIVRLERSNPMLEQQLHFHVAWINASLNHEEEKSFRSSSRDVNIRHSPPSIEERYVMLNGVRPRIQIPSPRLEAMTAKT